MKNPRYIDQATEVADSLNWEFNIDVDVRESYSGRSMYGASVPALVIEPGDEIAVGYVWAKLTLDPDDMPRRHDSLGLNGLILY